MLHVHRRPSVRRRAAVAGICLIVALAGAIGAPWARADGDPASDVLVTSDVFVPVELNVDRQTELLQALLGASARAGFEVRVALIAAPDDLGTVTALWRSPVAYSQYLGTELSLSFPGQVVVVMPNGIGVWAGRQLAPTAAERRVAATLPAPGAGQALVAGAITAVERLAAAEGHPVSTGGLRVAAPAAVAGSGAALPWLVFGAGLVLVIVAWGASLRARPPSLRRRAAA